MLIQFFLSKKFSGNRNEAVTFGYLRARVFAQRVRRPLAIRDSAVFNGGWRPRRSKCGSGKFVPEGLRILQGTLSFPGQWASTGRKYWALSTARKYGHMSLAP
jgi:hypothetical protein